jgi:hypothetical protein
MWHLGHVKLVQEMQMNTEFELEDLEEEKTFT